MPGTLGIGEPYRLLARIMIHFIPLGDDFTPGDVESRGGAVLYLTRSEVLETEPEQAAADSIFAWFRGFDPTTSKPVTFHFRDRGEVETAVDEAALGIQYNQHFPQVLEETGWLAPFFANQLQLDP